MERQSAVRTFLRHHPASAWIPLITVLCFIPQPAYACADVGAGLFILGGIIFAAVLGPLILGGLLVGACDKIKFSGYGLLMGIGTFAMTAPFCLTIAVKDIGYAHDGLRLLLMVTPGVLSALCLLITSLQETKEAAEAYARPK